MKTGCWFCRTEMRWESDFNREDFGLEGDGVVTVLTCPNCQATAQFYSPTEEEPKCEKSNQNGNKNTSQELSQ